MRLKCPGCGTWLCDDEELNEDGDEVPIEMKRIDGGRWAVTEIEHTPKRCAATRNDRAARVETAARGLVQKMADGDDTKTEFRALRAELAEVDRG